MSDVRKIKIGELKVPKHNVRVSNAGDGIDDLKASIRSIGLIEPITVFEKSGQYLALVGQRRLLAYSELNEEFPGQGFDEIDCIVRSMPDDDGVKRAISLGGNITHLPMSKKDAARAATDLYDKSGSHEAAGEMFGLSRHMVDKYVGLSRLPDELKQAIRGGELHPRQARAERVALDAADALRYVRGGSVSVDKVLELARMMARKSEISKEIIEEAKNPLRDIGEIERRAGKRRRVELRLFLSAELDSRLGTYSEREGYDSREAAAVDIISEGLDAQEGL